MDQLQFLQAFGVDMVKGGHIVLQRRAVMQEILLKGPRKREDMKKQIISLLLDLWRLRALPRDALDSMARTIELVVKSMFRQCTLPSIDWKKLVQEAIRQFEAPAGDKENMNYRSRSRQRNSQLRNWHRHDSRSPLQRRTDPSAARSKSMAKPGSRIVLMNTEQTVLCRQSGELLETPRSSCAPTVPDSDAEIEVPPRQLFSSPHNGHGSVPPDHLQIVPCIGTKNVGAHGGDFFHHDMSVAAALAPDAPKDPKAFSKFAQHRVKWPPYDPHEITRAQVRQFTTETGEDCLDFVSHCSEGIRLDKLYLFYRELAKAGIYIDILYWGSSFQKLINSQGIQRLKSCACCDHPFGSFDQLSHLYIWTRQTGWQNGSERSAGCDASACFSTLLWHAIEKTCQCFATTSSRWLSASRLDGSAPWQMLAY